MHPEAMLESLRTPRLPTWKRTMDIVGAFSGLIVLSPLLLLVAMIIKMVSSGPVLFRQVRIGYLGKPFIMLKFRTMYVNNDTSVHCQYIGTLINNNQEMKKLDLYNDPRIIPFGKLLRLLFLDELPQFVNVLRGEMSLVGPRPELPYVLQHYRPWQMVRFGVAPGMTGPWQVSGKNHNTFEEMMRMDAAYAKKMSFWLDTKILLLTVRAIISEILDFLNRNKRV